MIDINQNNNSNKNMDQLPTEILFLITRILGFHNITAFTLITMDLYQIFHNLGYKYLIDEIKDVTSLDIRDYNLRQLIHLSKFNNNSNRICCNQMGSLILNKNTNELCHIGSQRLSDKVNFNVQTIKIPKSSAIIDIASAYNYNLLLDKQNKIYILACNDIPWLEQMNDTEDKIKSLSLLRSFNLDVIKIKNTSNGCLILTRDGEIYVALSVLELIAKRSNIIDIESCFQFTFMLSKDGYIYILQHNNHGSIITKFNIIQDIISISSGGDWLLALNKYGNVYYIEINLSDKAFTKGFIPHLVSDISGIIQIVNNYHSALLLTNYGHVYRLDILNPPNFNIQPIDGLKDIVQVSTCVDHYLALTSSGNVYRFRFNDNLKLLVQDEDIIYP